MTVQIHLGRRIPRSWFRRQASKVKGLITFQENIWQIIKQSLNLAKRKANAAGTLKFIMTTDKEIEDLNYEIEWIKIIIQGTEKQEEEEYNDSMKLYGPLTKTLKKEIPKDDRMKKHFKTKVLSAAKVDDAYSKGYGAMGDNNVANKLLEMGILTHVELIKDYETREKEFKSDF